MAMDLSHHLDREWFVEAFRRTRKDGAVGVDGISGSEYGESLDERIGALVHGSVFWRILTSSHTMSERP